MKSPNHARPSGDRRIARLLIKALEHGGHRVEVMSDLRAWEGRGNQAAQKEICTQASAASEKMIENIRARPRERKPDIWFSYHLYHKAPDWIGPRVTGELNIPYVVAEASYAPRQKHGVWSMGLKQVVTGLKQAAAIICLNPRDIKALRQLPESENKLHSLQPFLDIEGIAMLRASTSWESLAQQYGLDPTLPWLVCVAMMRDDAKLRSYENLAKSLEQVSRPYQLLVIGDGKARPRVEKLFTGKLAQHTRYTGQLDQDATIQVLAGCDLFVWPAVNEAIGMAILEAQACGLPVVVGSSGAIPAIVRDGQTGFVCDSDDIQTTARRIEQLLEDPGLREAFSVAATKNIQQNHSLTAAADSLEQILRSVQS